MTGLTRLKYYGRLIFSLDIISIEIITEEIKIFLISLKQVLYSEMNKVARRLLKFSDRKLLF